MAKNENVMLFGMPGEAGLDKYGKPQSLEDVFGKSGKSGAYGERQLAIGMRKFADIMDCPVALYWNLKIPTKHGFLKANVDGAVQVGNKVVLLDSKTVVRARWWGTSNKVRANFLHGVGCNRRSCAKKNPGFDPDNPDNASPMVCKFAGSAQAISGHTMAMAADKYRRSTIKVPGVAYVLYPGGKFVKSQAAAFSVWIRPERSTTGVPVVYIPGDKLIQQLRKWLPSAPMDQRTMMALRSYTTNKVNPLD